MEFKFWKAKKEKEINSSTQDLEEAEMEAVLENESEKKPGKKKAAKPRKTKKAKRKPLPVWASICIAVLMAVVVVLLVMLAVDYFNGPFKNYTASDWRLRNNRNAVVATVGDQKLTNAELQVYYWMYVYSFMDENGAYLSTMGFDYTKDFAKQECYLKKGSSWQEYFLENALLAWQQYAVLLSEAQKSGFTVAPSEQEYLDGLWETMNEKAKGYGYKDGQEMLEKEMGAGATFDAYLKHTKETFIGMGYYDKYAMDIKISEEEIDAYYEANKEAFEDSEIFKEDTDIFCVGVRHILIMPKATKDENGKDVVTEEAWETCRKEAQALLDGYLQKGQIDEEAFAALAKEHSEDPGSKEQGGLYAQFFKEQMVKPFEEWSFAQERKYGDTGLVKTDYGYHVMFFVNNHTEWHYMADYSLRMDACKEMVNKLMEANPLQVDYKKILLSHVALGE